MTLSAEARARLDRHLDAVEQALGAAGNSRERRRAVVDDLEAQIQEMLAAKSAAPTVEDVEAVLAKLDPPAAYGESGIIRERAQLGQAAAGGEARVVDVKAVHVSKRRSFMRSSAVIALIVCGTLLVMTPAIF